MQPITDPYLSNHFTKIIYSVCKRVVFLLVYFTLDTFCILNIYLLTKAKLVRLDPQISRKSCSCFTWNVIFSKFNIFKTRPLSSMINYHSKNVPFALYLNLRLMFTSQVLQLNKAFKF